MIERMPAPLQRKMRRAHWTAVGGLVVLTLLMFGDVLFTPRAVLISQAGTDIWAQDVYYREFGFGELRKGNFPLWNPHIYSGTPFFGGGQTGLLYPPNIIFLFLPVYRAINIEIALHFFLIGFFMYLWAVRWRLRPLSAFMAAALLMLSGAYFLNVFAGHLGPIAGMAWIPLVFLCLDGAVDRPSAKWLLLGIFTGAMQIAAGAPQYVLFTGLAGGIYAALRLIRARRRMTSILVMLGMALGATALMAVEVLPSLQTTSESTRGGGVPWTFAKVYSFPPENLFTLIVPYFFGNPKELVYWGRGGFWEMVPAIGVTGFIVAIYGIFPRRKGRALWLVMCGLMFLLAIGWHTPLYRLLYDWVPGFDGIRGMTKFIFYMMLFVCLFAGRGIERLQRHRPGTGLTIGVGIGFLLLTVAGLGLISIDAQAPDWWVRIMEFIVASKEALMNSDDLQHSYMTILARESGGAILYSAGALLVMLTLLIALRFKRKAFCLLLILVLGEAFLYARYMRATFPYAITRPEVGAVTVELLQPADRVVFPQRPDAAMVLPWDDIWGYGPFVLRRYAEVIGASQGLNPDEVVKFVEFPELKPVYRMFRCRALLDEDGGILSATETLSNPLPRLLLMNDYALVGDRDEALSVLLSKDFHPWQTVLLEEKPSPAPDPQAQGTAHVVDESTDHLTIEAELDKPAILLVTDAYAKDWRVTALTGSVQETYHILPANYALRAVPLSAGRHSFRMEYRPQSFIVGRGISMGALVFFVLAVIAVFVRRRAVRHS